MAKLVSTIAQKGPIWAKGAVDYGKPRLATFLKYAKVELVPPTPAELPQVVNGIQKIMAGARTGRWKQLTVKEAWLNTLVTAEVCFWFFIGECIGKRAIIGYQV